MIDLLRFIPHRRLIAAVAIGVGWALAFPQPGWASLAWLVPAALWLTTAPARGWAAFRLGYAAGLSHHLVALGWLLYIPFPGGAIAGWLALALYLSLYPACWTWWVSRGTPQQWRWPGRALWMLLAAAAWVTLEMIRARLFTGFPWNLLGVSQYRLVPLIQVAEWTGVYGLSFVMVWCSLAAGSAAWRVKATPGRPWTFLSDVLLPLGLVMGLAVWGLGRVRPSSNARTLRLALIQPSIPQTLIWDPAEDATRLGKVLDLSTLALAGRPDVLVWPESAMPPVTETNYAALARLVRQQGVWLIFGAEDVEWGAAPDEYQVYNAAFLLDRRAQVQGRYRKQRLVVFGEYIPLRRWLPFLEWFTPIRGGFASGPGPTPFRLDDLATTVSVLICFEDVFPHLTRHHARGATEVLVNLTNNGWFGRSSAQWQHAANAVFRAVENRRPLVRCTNNGLTCWIDDAGVLREIFGHSGGDVYEPGFLLATIPLPEAETTRPETFYTRHGDAFGWACAAVTALGLAASLLRKKPLPSKAADSIA